LLEYIAVILIAAGLFLLIQGLRERFPLEEDYMSYETGTESGKYAAIHEPERRSEVKGGGVILIGPIPIVFGNSKYAVIALILTLILMVLAITFMVRV